MAIVWLEYGYSMAKAWDKECTVFSRPSFAFGKLQASPKGLLGLAKGMPRVCERFA